MISYDQNSAGDILNYVPMSLSESLLTELVLVPLLRSVYIVAHPSAASQLQSSRRLIRAPALDGTRALSSPKLLSCTTSLHGKMAAYVCCCRRHLSYIELTMYRNFLHFIGEASADWKG